MTTLSIKPTHKAILAYYESLRAYGDQGVSHETAVRSAFQNLLAETGLAAEDLPAQMDRDGWPRLRKRFTELFKTKSRAEAGRCDQHECGGQAGGNNSDADQDQ